jgi:hypothetical protein
VGKRSEGGGQEKWWVQPTGYNLRRGRGGGGQKCRSEIVFGVGGVGGAAK